MAGWVDVVDKGITAGAALVGVAAGYFGQRLTSKAAHDREEAGRTAERELRFADYQRTTLHDLQEALVELQESTLDASWPGELGASKKMVMRQYRASARVTLLTQRVSGADARSAIEAAAARFEEVMRTQEPTREMARAAEKTQEEAQGALGIAIRGLP